MTLIYDMPLRAEIPSWPLITRRGLRRNIGNFVEKTGVCGNLGEDDKGFYTKSHDTGRTLRRLRDGDYIRVAVTNPHDPDDNCSMRLYQVSL